VSAAHISKALNTQYSHFYDQKEDHLDILGLHVPGHTCGPVDEQTGWLVGGGDHDGIEVQYKQHVRSVLKDGQFRR